MNKNILVLACFIFGQFSIISQTHYPFPTDSATWSVATFFDDPFVGPYTCITKHYGLVGDTTIGTMTYNKLYANNRPEDFPYFDTAFNLPTARYMGAIREDSVKKVWMRTPSDTVDILYYDFGLNVGDIFCFNRSFFPSGGTGCLNDPVSWIDSLLVDGAYRRRINFQSGESWVEGIGSLTGWFEWPYIGSEEYALWCYSEHQIQLYGVSSCHCDTYIGTGIDDANFNLNLTIYPNPFNDEFIISISEPVGYYQVNDVSGRLICTGELDGSKTAVNMKNQSAGVYFINIISPQSSQQYKMLKSK
ncbi:MAG: T9SS type A sorting domain-containing protein [Flavobacteriales bacterium]|nr:T9SS type A sorting domain-containing protein [Flavobacteriales bacterium]